MSDSAPTELPSQEIDALRSIVALRRAMRDEQQGHGTPFSDLFK